MYDYIFHFYDKRMAAIIHHSLNPVEEPPASLYATVSQAAYVMGSPEKNVTRESKFSFVKPNLTHSM
jgi:hypothetical protein